MTPERSRTGDPVTAVGNAGGEGGLPSVSPGTITALDQTITVGEPGSGEVGQLSGLIQTDAALEPGDSGGPMYDADGVVIGISTAADTGRGYDASRESYAVAIDTAESIAEQISAGQGSSTIQIGLRGFLGVQVRDTADGGAVIDSVLDGTPAADAGLRAGDVITAVARPAGRVPGRAQHQPPRPPPRRRGGDHLDRRRRRRAGRPRSPWPAGLPDALTRRSPAWTNGWP